MSSCYAHETCGAHEYCDIHNQCYSCDYILEGHGECDAFDVAERGSCAHVCGAPEPEPEPDDYGQTPTTYGATLPQTPTYGATPPPPPPTTAADCYSHDSCGAAEYCDIHHACYSCEYILNRRVCDAFDAAQHGGSCAHVCGGARGAPPSPSPSRYGPVVGGGSSYGSSYGSGGSSIESTIGNDKVIGGASVGALLLLAIIWLAWRWIQKRGEQRPHDPEKDDLLDVDRDSSAELEPDDPEEPPRPRPEPEPQPDWAEPQPQPQPQPQPEPEQPWWREIDPPSGQVTREEIRSLSARDQRRYVAAIEKMMENEDGPGTSQYFRLASYHGGPTTDRFNVDGEHCVHGYEAFPGWHRAYLLEFEDFFRRADMANGNDGRFGLPYWGWDDVTVRGEVFPRILRERFPELPPDLLPRGVSLEDSRLEVDPDPQLDWISDQGDVARQSLRTAQHWQHACTRGNRGAGNASLEDPHNSVHARLGGTMATFMSSFHPVFWLHHNNIDRFYEKYLELHPDSHGEFREKQEQRKADDSHRVADGYPEGSYGTYHGGHGSHERERPFTTRDGTPFHARHTFSARQLGYRFDTLPEPSEDTARNLLEMPVFAVFAAIDISEMEQSRNLFVFVVSKDKAEQFDPGLEPQSFLKRAEYAGCGSIFGLFPPGGCRACRTRPPFDVAVDITAALRRNRLLKAEAALVVVVQNAVDGTCHPLASTPVPSPTIRGGLFESELVAKTVSSEGGDNHAPDVLALQKFLVAHGYKATDAVDGEVGDVTAEAIRAFQRAAGLKVDGVAGPKTKGQMVAPQFDSEKHVDVGHDTAKFSQEEEVTWALESLPGYLDATKVQKELQTAFDAWGVHCGLTFHMIGPSGRPSRTRVEGARVSIRFDGSEQSGESGRDAFDGPGGELAQVDQDGDTLLIRFDEEEKWLLQGEPEGFGQFYLLPVAVHEVGHVLGLGHSANPSDVMAPYYRAELTELRPNDIERCQKLYPRAPTQQKRRSASKGQVKIGPSA